MSPIQSSYSGPHQRKAFLTDVVAKCTIGIADFLLPFKRKTIGGLQAAILFGLGLYFIQLPQKLQHSALDS